MIFELTKENISEISNTFIDYKIVLNELMNNPFGKYLIYKENNAILGFIYYSDIYDRVEINQFEIEASHRSCGKGKILLNKLLEVVDKDITLEVKKDNYPAIKLYKSVGFKEIAIRKGYYQGIDGILMERKNN